MEKNLNINVKRGEEKIQKHKQVENKTCSAFNSHLYQNLFTFKSIEG